MQTLTRVARAYSIVQVVVYQDCTAKDKYTDEIYMSFHLYLRNNRQKLYLIQNYQC